MSQGFETYIRFTPFVYCRVDLSQLTVAFSFSNLRVVLYFWVYFPWYTCIWNCRDFRLYSVLSRDISSQ